MTRNMIPLKDSLTDAVDDIFSKAKSQPLQMCFDSKEVVKDNVSPPQS